MYGLDFISDSDLSNHVKETAKKYRFHINLKSFNHNIIDPVKLTFDAAIYRKDIQDIIKDEIMRQIDKSNTNHIGYFHQNIFKYMGNGWSIPVSGYDLVNQKLHYYVEMKNKHNTMNSSSSQKTYLRMQNTILNDDQTTCMLVEIIAKDSQDKIWNISVDGNAFSNRNIRRVSIDKFYALVTGQHNAFMRLCECLPKVLEDVIDEEFENKHTDTVLSELKQISPNILKSLYLLSFSKYEGFSSFNEHR